MKLVIIGGAGVRSVFFTNGLALKSDKMNIDDLVLFDIDEKKLEIMGALCIHAAKLVNQNLKVSINTNFREAVKGADYIVTTVRVGFDKSRVVDEEICLKNGVLGQETTGAGGFSMALRTIPVMLEYMKIVQEIAPNAIVFNFTNPSGLVTQAMRDAGFNNVLGICDAPSSTKIAMAEYLNVPSEKLFTQFAGLNHLSFITSVQLEEKELLPDLLKNDDFLKNIKEFSMFDPELIRTIGHLPNEYLYYFYYKNRSLNNVKNSFKARGRVVYENNIKMFDSLSEFNKNTQIDKMMGTYLRFMYNRESTYMNTETNSKLKHKEFDGKMPDSEGYAGVMMNYCMALANDCDREMVLSIPCEDSYYGLKPADVMEVTCIINKSGARIQRFGELSTPAMALINSIKQYENLTVEAAIKCDSRAAIAALTVHPLINDYEVSKALFNDLLIGNKEYLKNWF